MKMLIKMTANEYKCFRKYTCKMKGFDYNSTREFTSDFKGQEAEDWLLETGKIELREWVDGRGRKYHDAYLVLHGSEEYCNDVIEILFTEEVYKDLEIITGRKIMKTVLQNRNLENRIIREI